MFQFYSRSLKIQSSFNILLYSSERREGIGAANYKLYTVPGSRKLFAFFFSVLQFPIDLLINLRSLETSEGRSMCLFRAKAWSNDQS